MSTKPKRVNPYELLRQQVQDVLTTWKNRRAYTLFSYKRPVRGGVESLNYGELFDAVVAAQKCDMRVTIEVRDGQLDIVARPRIQLSDMPWQVWMDGELP